MDKAELLKSMLHDFINGKQDQAEVTLHQYFVTKSQEMTGTAPQETPGTLEAPEEDTLAPSDE